MPGLEPLAIGNLTLTEALQGFAQERDFEQARILLTSLTVVDLGGPDIAIQAARHFRRLREFDVTIRNTIEVFIAMRRVESGYTLLHRDRNFEPFAKHLGLHSAV